LLFVPIWGKKRMQLLYLLCRVFIRPFHLQLQPRRSRGSINARRKNWSNWALDAWSTVSGSHPFNFLLLSLSVFLHLYNNCAQHGWFLQIGPDLGVVCLLLVRPSRLEREAAVMGETQPTIASAAGRGKVELLLCDRWLPPFC
jgi:hypothetical protein